MDTSLAGERFAARGTLVLLQAAELGGWLAAFGTLPDKFGDVGRADLE